VEVASTTAVNRGRPRAAALARQVKTGVGAPGERRPDGLPKRSRRRAKSVRAFNHRGSSPTSSLQSRSSSSTQGSRNAIPFSRSRGTVGFRQAATGPAVIRLSCRVGGTVSSERHLLLRSNNLAPINMPATARRPARPFPITGAGTPHASLQSDVILYVSGFPSEPKKNPG
jgi:hypothetical protein